MPLARRPRDRCTIAAHTGLGPRYARPTTATEIPGRQSASALQRFMAGIKTPADGDFPAGRYNFLPKLTINSSTRPHPINTSSVGFVWWPRIKPRHRTRGSRVVWSYQNSNAVFTRAFKKPIGSATRLERGGPPRVHRSPASRIIGLTRAQAAEPIGADTEHQIVSNGFQGPVGGCCRRRQFLFPTTRKCQGCVFVSANPELNLLKGVFWK